MVEHTDSIASHATEYVAPRSAVERFRSERPHTHADLLDGFQIARRGEDTRFAGSVLRVPAGTLRDRNADVLSPSALVQQHAGYRNRVQIGPSWRADVWTVLEDDPLVTVAEAARRAGCSFAAAWQVVQDFGVLRSADRGSSSRVA